MDIRRLGLLVSLAVFLAVTSLGLLSGFIPMPNAATTVVATVTEQADRISDTVGRAEARWRIPGTTRTATGEISWTAFGGHLDPSTRPGQRVAINVDPVTGDPVPGDIPLRTGLVLTLAVFLAAGALRMYRLLATDAAADPVASS